MATLGELVVRLSASTAEFTAAIDKAGHLFHKRMEGMVAGAKQLGVAMGASIAAGAVGFAAVVKNIADEADAIGETSEKLGVGVEALSALGYAAQLSGVSTETLHGSINKLNKSIAEGNPAFEAMGINVRDSNGHLKTADQMLNEVAGKFAGYKDGAAKSALAMEIFGKQGAEMIPMLNKGKDGLQALIEEAERFGLVFGKDVTESAGAVNDNIDRVRAIAKGAATQIAIGLLPTMQNLSDRFVSTANNSDFLQKASERLSVMLKLLATSGSIVYTVFEVAGSLIASVAGAAVSAAQGDFKQAWQILNTGGWDMVDSVRGSLNTIAGIWDETAVKIKKAGENSGGGKDDPPFSKAAKAAREAIENDLTWVAKLYAKAMEGVNSAQLEADKSTRELNGAQSALLELMSSPGWELMPDNWREMVIAQTASATAAIDVANQQKRLNDLLSATPTAVIEQQQKDMLLLAEAYEKGTISAEEFNEAAMTRLGTLPKVAEEAASTIETVITNAFDGAANAMADFVMGGKASFGDLINAMIRDLIRLEFQSQMTSIWKAAGGFSGIAESVGGWISSFGSSSGVAGTRAMGGGVSPGSTYLVGENGPELLTMGATSGFVTPNNRMSGGVVVNVIESPGNGGKQSQRTDPGGVTIIDVLVEKVKGAVASDIGSGGVVAGALEGQYGLNRAAGAWR